MHWYSIIAFWFALGMSSASFLLFCYLALAEAAARRKEMVRATRNLESLSKVGDLAEKFGKSGTAPSVLACAVVFMVGCARPDRSALRQRPRR
jgi:hypothetical protein